MPPATRKPRLTRAERQERRREEIGAELLTALAALLDDGTSYTELSVERLIREAGLARSTFYAYFEDKGDVLHEIGGRVVDELVESLGTWMALAPGATDEDLAAGVRALVEAYLPHRVIVAAIAETAAHDARVRALLEDRIDVLVGHLAMHFREGLSTGLVRPHVDPEATAVWVAALLERGLHKMLGPGLTDDADRTVDGVTSLIWNAVYRERA